MAELAACNAGTEVKVADSDAVILEMISKVIVAFGHGSDEDCYALVLVEASDVVAYTHNFRIEAEGDLAAVGWEVVSDGVLDDLDELFLGCRGADLMAMEQLDHQTSEALECSRNADSWAHANEHVFGGLYVDLKLARLVDGRIKERKEALDATLVQLAATAADPRYVYAPDG